MQKLSEDTTRTLHMAETLKQPFLIINVAVSPAPPMALQITVAQATPPTPPPKGEIEINKVRSSHACNLL